MTKHLSVAMPTPPEGHYWRIGKAAAKDHLRVYLMERRRWWFGREVEWSVFALTGDEHLNATRAVDTARYVLRERQKHVTSGLNGLTGYVDAKGRKH